MSKSFVSHFHWFGLSFSYTRQASSSELWDCLAFALTTPFCTAGLSARCECLAAELIDVFCSNLNMWVNCWVLFGFISSFWSCCCFFFLPLTSRESLGLNSLSSYSSLTEPRAGILPFRGLPACCFELGMDILAFLAFEADAFVGEA